MSALTDKRKEKFCQQLVVHSLTQADAYRAAYPGSKKWKAASVHVKASQLMAQDKVRLRVYELKEEAAKIAEEQFKVDAEYVLRRLVEIDRMDFADIFEEGGEALKPVAEWPETWRTFISGFDVQELWAGTRGDRHVIGLLRKIKWPDKIRNLELLGKHVSVNAFREQIGLGSPEGGPIETHDVTWREKLRQENK